MTTKEIKDIDDLNAIQEHMNRQKQLRQGGLTARITVHMGTCGNQSGAQKVMDTLFEEVSKYGRSDILILGSSCIGLCNQEPLVTVEVLGEEPIIYHQVDIAKIRQIFKGHILDGEIQTPYALARGKVDNEDSTRTGSDKIPHISQIPFFALQKSWVLRNRGLIDPEKIEDYIWRDGYQALAKALREMTPPEIISEVKTSGLRDRGTKGFPTGIKWEFYASSKDGVKYVLCNGDEGDPNAFVSRSLMEFDPHTVIEGIMIAAKAISSHQGYIYCPAKYSLAIKRLNLAIQQARQYGLLGKNIIGSGFHFDLEVYQGVDPFLCGEQTALIESIEGRRGVPRPQPPFPDISHLWEKPTVVNNVETLANIPQIILKGGERFAKIGTELSKGTKIFSLMGKVNHIGLIEVPMGTTIGEIVFDIGGGISSGKKFKAVHLGGPAGGCIPVEYLNTRIDYEAINKVGEGMGSSGLIVLDDDTCMVEMARSFMDFSQKESCGRCPSCQVGIKRLLEILQRICKGEGGKGDIELLEDLAHQVKDAALCSFCQAAPNIVLSTLRYFRQEYETHIFDKRCPAAACSALFKSPCQHTCPVGMDIPGYIALLQARRFDDAYKVLKQTNPFPSVCGRICEHPCQVKCRRGQLDEPIAIMHLKRFITDHARKPPVKPLPITRKEKVAIVGAGPSGLTAALELKKRGYAVTVFEKLPEAGGMLRWAIPAYRLPREELSREIQEILDTGVELRTNVCVGRDISFEALNQQFDILYLSVGADRSITLNIPGEDADGVLGGVEFLRDYHLLKEVRLGRNVAVIGGGNTAFEAARTAIRLGAKKVTIYYRRQRKDMPAPESKIKAAEEEGVRIMELVAPVRIVPQYGKATRIELTQMRLDKFDLSGRRQPKPILGSEFMEKVDTVIYSIGQNADLEFLPKESPILINPKTLQVDKHLRTPNAKVWAGGEVVSGAVKVIDAIKAGQKAAHAIDEAIRLNNGEEPWIPPEEEKIVIPYEMGEEPRGQPQVPMPELSPELRRKNFREVELGYTMEKAIAEARRCLRCDVSMESKIRRH